MQEVARPKNLNYELRVTLSGYSRQDVVKALEGIAKQVETATTVFAGSSGSCDSYWWDYTILRRNNE